MRYYILGLVRHDQNNERQGAITMVLPGKRSLSRAWFQAIVLAMRFTVGRHQLQIHNSQAWEAWNVKGQHGQYYDIAMQVNERHFERIKAIYCKEVLQQIKGKSGWKSRMKDANFVVTERIEQVRDHASEEWVHEQDRKARQVYEQAIVRIRAIVEDKSHFGHEKKEPSRELRAKTRTRKIDLLRSLPQDSVPGHQWQPHRRGYQCIKCETFVTIQTSYDMLKTVKESQCNARAPQVSGGKKQTRDQVLDAMVKETQEATEGHQWCLQGAYLKCQKCNQQRLKRSRWELIQELVDQPCINGAWQPHSQWKGHSTHSMWQRADLVFCQICQGRAKAGQPCQASAKLIKACSGSAKRRTIRAAWRTSLA